MSQQNVIVRIFFKTEEGPKPSSTYSFTQGEFDRLKRDFINKEVAGAYTCSYSVSNGWLPTELLLKFDEVVYIGG